VAECLVYSELAPFSLPLGAGRRCAMLTSQRAVARTVRGALNGKFPLPMGHQTVASSTSKESLQPGPQANSAHLKA
jgi:hypothetical protein